MSATWRERDSVTRPADQAPVVINGGVLNSVRGNNSWLGPLTMTGGTVSGNQFNPPPGLATLGSARRGGDQRGHLPAGAKPGLSRHAARHGCRRRGSAHQVREITQAGGPYALDQGRPGIHAVQRREHVWRGHDDPRRNTAGGQRHRLGAATAALAVNRRSRWI